MTEFAPPGRRGLFGSWQSFTVLWACCSGPLFGPAVSALLALTLTGHQLKVCDWRIPSCWACR